MLRKTALVTVIPGSPGQAYAPASETCTPKAVNPNDNLGAPGIAPPPSGSVVPAPGTPIILETPNGSGGYVTSNSVAPAPAGYVCRREAIWVYTPGDPSPAVQYQIVCTAP
jgi:hypothetical protein